MHVPQWTCFLLLKILQKFILIHATVGRDKPLGCLNIVHRLAKYTAITIKQNLLHSFQFFEINIKPVLFLSDMFGLAGLVSARAIVLKMTSPGNIGKALGYFMIVHSVMESLAPEYYLLYTSTKKSYYSKFIYCFNAITFILVRTYSKQSSSWNGMLLHSLDTLEGE